MAKLSPMMERYQEVKAENPGSLLLFRMGDFMNCFTTTPKLLPASWA